MNPLAKALALDLVAVLDAAERDPQAAARIEQTTLAVLGRYPQLVADEQAATEVPAR